MRRGRLGNDPLDMMPLRVAIAVRHLDVMLTEASC